MSFRKLKDKESNHNKRTALGESTPDASRLDDSVSFLVDSGFDHLKQ